MMKKSPREWSFLMSKWLFLAALSSWSVIKTLESHNYIVLWFPTVFSVLCFASYAQL